jgi:hypothetical protein
MSLPDIRKSRKWLSAEEIWLLALMLLILAAALVLNITLARLLPGGEWFFLRWSGARAFLIEQIEPYGTAIARRVQDVAYGRPAFSSEYAYVLNDPFYIVLLYTPLAFLQDFALARGIWIFLSEAALVGTVLFAFNLTEWQPPRWLYVSLLIFGLFSNFSLNALISGSPAIMLTFLYLCILLALRTYSDELAGALLFLVAYQWEVSSLFFLFILVFVIANRRWNVFAGFGMSLFILLMVSFLSYPGWGLPYLRAVLSDWYRSENLNFGSVLSTWFPNLRFSMGAIVSIALCVVVFLESLTSVQAHFRRVVWTASLSLAATPLLGLVIFPSNYVVLIMPLVLLLTLVWERWRHSRVLITILIFSFSVLIPFGLYIHTVLIYDPFYSDLLAVLPPVATIVSLYWMRWWVLHSPRTWIDQIGIHK